MRYIGGPTDGPTKLLSYLLSRLARDWTWRNDLKGDQHLHFLKCFSIAKAKKKNLFQKKLLKKFKKYFFSKTLNQYFG